MSKFAKIPLMIAGVGAGLFVGTFTMYMFNLDMKMMTIVAPLLEKWYEKNGKEKNNKNKINGRN